MYSKILTLVIAGTLAIVSMPVMAADPGNGAQVYSVHCSGCHGDDGRGGMPGLPDFTRGEGLFQPNSQLATTIRNGKQVMPAYQGILTNDDINDVIAYLRSFR